MKRTVLFMCGVMSASMLWAQTPSYTNPVSKFNLPDPTVIKAADGRFYLYATQGNLGLVPIMRSDNLVDWQQVGAAFTPDTKPAFIDGKGNVWAPDINKIGDKYVLHYALSIWDELHKNGVGVAVSDSPEGPFTDLGPMFTSDEIGVTNSIDQFYIRQGKRKYMFWGSFYGLYYVELASDGLSVKKGAVPVKVAGNAYEAVYIHKKDGYYYMFTSTGSCCAGLQSTYKVVVGRSKSLFGPYLDKQGGNMLDNKHEIVLQGDDRFKGPGHNAEFMTDAAGTDWMLYHSYDSEKPRGGRTLMLDRVDWVDGWPVVGDGTPSSEAAAPLF